MYTHTHKLAHTKKKEGNKNVIQIREEIDVNLKIKESNKVKY